MLPDPSSLQRGGNARLSVHMNPLKSNAHWMHIESNPPQEVAWKRIETGYIIIHNLREVMPSMRFLACSLAWLVVVLYIASFCSALAATLGKEEACFLKGVVQRGKIK